jgi:DNA polymerase V
MSGEVAILRNIESDLIRTGQAFNTEPTGFPSPAADYLEDSINIQEYLTPNPTSTFYVRYTGDSMKESGIFPGSILVIDRSLPLKNNTIVMAVVNGELYVKHYIKNRSGIRLVPSNKNYQPIPITEDMDFSIWGRVSKIITDVDCIS